MLVPIQMYIDGAVSDQFGKLEVEALKITMGLFNAKAREKRHAWRTLGYVPSYHRSSTRGKRQFEATGHIATSGIQHSEDEEEAVQEEIGENAHETEESSDHDSQNSDDQSQFQQNIVENPDDKVYQGDEHKNQDWHFILDHLLQTYRQLEKDGMVWHYKYRGKVYENIELVFFLHIVKCDNEEADKLCGKFTARTQHVKQICRFCECPTLHSSWCFGDKFPKKKEHKIKALVANNEVEELRAMSQAHLKNAFYGLQFGTHNKQGMHGACPMEMLHHILLGIFKYVTDGFKEQIGLTSEGLDEINALAKTHGFLFTRNSDRDLPKTHFGKGILHGKIQGKEYSGVLLVMAAVLQSNEGRTMLKKMPKFKYNKWLDDWSMLIETLLQWEQYLKQPEMELKHLKRLQDKHILLMGMIKQVLKRSKGMGLDLLKYHGILHLCEQILDNGVPNIADTGANESHHKPTKYYSRLTQKDQSKFEKQTAAREDEFFLLDMALMELEGKFSWEYLDTDQVRGPPKSEAPAPDNENIVTDSEDSEDEEPVVATGGTALRVHATETGDSSWEYKKNPNKFGAWDDQVVEYLCKVQKGVQEHVSELDIRCEHTRDGIIFRGHPNFRGKSQWNDHVLCQWEGTDGLPAEIWCFVDLSGLPEGVEVQLPDYKAKRGVYAVVESGTYVKITKKMEEEELNRRHESPQKRQKTKKSGPIVDEPKEPSSLGSDMFRPFKKDVLGIDGKGGVTRRFYMVDVDAFLEPILVVPDIGSVDILRYFHVKPRNKWHLDFITWLEEDEESAKEMKRLEEEEGTEEYKLEAKPEPRKPSKSSKKQKPNKKDNAKGKKKRGKNASK